MARTGTRRKLTSKQARVFKERILAIREEHRKLQAFLTEAGIEPVGGWPDPSEFHLVRGLEVRDFATGTCAECSIVSFGERNHHCSECDVNLVQFNDIYFRVDPADRTPVVVESGGAKPGLRLYAKRR